MILLGSKPSQRLREQPVLHQSRRSGMLGGQKPRPTIRMPPTQALFIASSLLRTTHLGIDVPKSVQPQHVSEELVMKYFLDVWNDADIEDHVVRVIEEYMAAFKMFRYTYVQALGSPNGKEVLAHWSVRCAQLGDLWNRPPAGTVDEISGMTRFIIEKKKITRIETFREKMQHEMASADFGL